MARYIDADALKTKAFGKRGGLIHTSDIDEAPTAELPIKEKCCVCPHCDNCDVNEDGTIERKKGEWIQDRLVSTNGGTYGVRRCSNCENYYQDVGYGWNYCPNCGSDMRGKCEVDAK